MNSKFLIPLFLIFATLTNIAVAQQSGDFTYSSDGSAITITGYTGTGGSIVIPGSIAGLPVRAIGSNSFKNQTTITNIQIPAGVTSIGNFAFLSCSKLSRVYFEGAAPVDFGWHVFSYTAPRFAIYYFTGSAGFTSPTWQGYPTVRFDAPGDFEYTSDGNAITITAYLGSGGEVLVPGRIHGVPVTVIGDNAFLGKSTITGIVLQDSISSIGGRAFAGCGNLTEVHFIGNAPHLGSDVFAATHPDLIVYFKPGATGFTIPTWEGYPSSVTASGFRWISDGSSITITWCDVPPNAIVDIPESIAGVPVTTLVDGLFRLRVVGQPIIEGLIIPKSVENISALTFDGCFLPHIEVLPGNPWFTSEDGVVFSADGSRLIVCPPGKTGDYVIPERVSVLEKEAFYRCGRLNSVTIPKGITSIGDKSFYLCASLTEMIIPNGVTEIGEWAFFRCEKLSSISLPRSLTSIGNYAFWGCKNLTHVVIPSRVQKVGDDGFSGCENLLSVTFNGIAPSEFGARVFDNTNPGFNLKYYTGASGFTSPTWKGYPSVALEEQSSLVMWRERYFGTTGNTGIAADNYDADGDGHDNLSEFTAGTNPISSGDLLQPLSSIRSGNTFALTLSGKAGRVYQLQRSLNLRPGDWVAVGSASTPEADSVVELIDPESPGLRAFYRVQVTLP